MAQGAALTQETSLELSHSVKDFESHQAVRAGITRRRSRQSGKATWKRLSGPWTVQSRGDHSREGDSWGEGQREDGTGYRCPAWKWYSLGIYQPQAQLDSFLKCFY